MRRRLVFLTRRGCGLCADALPIVTEGAGWLGVEVETIDIGTDAELEAKYHLRIPVVLTATGRVVAEGQISTRQAVFAALRSRLGR